MDVSAITVTFGVIAYNEHDYLPALLEDLLKQTYEKKQISVILVDGESTDDTWQIMKDFITAHNDEYKEISIQKNPKRNQPAGWNVVISHSKEDVLLRIDAHARIPEDFIQRNIECIISGEYVCGGPRENIIDEQTPWKLLLLSAEQSMFGSGIASYRHETEKKEYVKSVFHGAYKREVLKKVGEFNEKLSRTEDNEYHYRVRKAGYKICYDPQIKSYYQTRSSLKGMLRQKYQNGFWIGKTLFICPGCISLFHLVPFGFVMAVLLTLVLFFTGIKWPLVLLWCAYGIMNLMMTIMSTVTGNKGKGYVIILPVIFLLLHAGYGLGTALGIIKGIVGK